MFRIELLSWEAARSRASEIRFEVFVAEQGVPREIELDEHDPLCVHALALDETGFPVGTGRLLPDGHIGRMAVRRAWRGRGVGGAILERLIDAARDRGEVEVALSAQVHALEFYRAYGFAEEGKPYVEAGIAHQAMRRRLADWRVNPRA
jgi:predicted GNAT family N-acyltransferase